MKFIYWLVKLLIEPDNKDPVKYKELYNYTEVLCALTIVGWVSKAGVSSYFSETTKKKFVCKCVWLG